MFVKIKKKLIRPRAFTWDSTWNQRAIKLDAESKHGIWPRLAGNLAAVLETLVVLDVCEKEILSESMKFVRSEVSNLMKSCEFSPF